MLYMCTCSIITLEHTKVRSFYIDNNAIQAYIFISYSKIFLGSLYINVIFVYIFIKVLYFTKSYNILTIICSSSMYKCKLFFFWNEFTKINSIQASLHDMLRLYSCLVYSLPLFKICKKRRQKC